MAAIAVYPPDASDPEIVYLQRNMDTSTSPQELSSISSLTSNLPSGPAPAIPRKSSRRRLRLSVVPETDVLPSPEPSPSSSEHSAYSSPASSASEWSAHTPANEDALDQAIQHFENWQLWTNRPPSYSTIDERPPVPPRASSRASMISLGSRRLSDIPPEYHVESPNGHQADPANSYTLTADEKDILRQSLQDDEADAEAEREESIYSMQMTESRTEDALPQSLESRTLRIHAKGIHPIRLPLPSKELCIQITNPDGTLAYTSTRVRRSSPNFSLVKPDIGNVIKTSFGKGITLTPLHSDSAVLKPFTLSSKGVRRSQTFTVPDGEGREFEWRYANTKTPKGRREERLVLVLKSSNSPERNDSMEAADSIEKVAVAAKLDNAKRLFPVKSEKDLACKRRSTLKRQSSTSGGILAAAKATAAKATAAPKQVASSPRILAQLVRTHAKEASRAGTGGDLVLELGCTELVPEEVVVATALVMMKKEQDRLRVAQAAVILAAIL